MKHSNLPPVVSVCMITYNHEQYIKEAVQSIVMQKTSFPFELIIGEDCSTDTTRSICIELQKEFPTIIKLVLPDKNKGVHKNLTELMLMSEGKYIALCEGDDYWSDIDKLQKQVDFLEQHPAYAVCAHDTLIRDDFDSSRNGVLFKDFEFNAFKGRYKNEYSIEDTFLGNIFHLSSVMVRNPKQDVPAFSKKVPMLDMVLFPFWAQFGKIYVLDDCMSVYRRNETSITNTDKRFLNAVLMLENRIFVYNELNIYFQNKYIHTINPLICNLHVELFFALWRVRRRKNAFVSLYKSFIISPLKAFSTFVTIAKQKKWFSISKFLNKLKK